MIGLINRYWGRAFATFVALALFAACVAATVQVYSDFSREAEESYSREQYELPHEAGRSPAARGRQGPAAYEPHCEAPRTSADAEVCAARAMARAAIETNRLTRLALRLAALGFVFAVVGAIVGLIGTILIWLAWRETRIANKIASEGHERALEVSNRNAAATVSSARFAREANALAEEMQRIQTRPYIHLVDIAHRIDDIQNNQGSSLRINIDINIRNFGQLPAKSAYIRGHCFVSAKDDLVSNPDIEGIASTALGAIPPGLDIGHGPFTLDLSDGEKDLLLSGESVVYFEGQIQYQDAFGESYFTNFRRNSIGMDATELIFIISSEWNEAE